jgi:hypothetical protein
MILYRYPDGAMADVIAQTASFYVCVATWNAPIPNDMSFHVTFKSLINWAHPVAPLTAAKRAVTRIII